MPRQDPGVNLPCAFGSHYFIDIGPDEAETQFCVIANCELKVFLKKCTQLMCCRTVSTT